ncbi:MAG: hypothetical protein MJE12_06080 [Alphaproteobacteria bacterium]|nr:hypothetical protein [Alphaproteobacteria bacterium]
MSAVSAADFPTPTDRTDMHALIARDFARYDPNYEKNKAARQEMLADMARRLFAFEAQGRNMACARQIFVEAKWLVGYTADWRRVDRRLKDLAKSLLQPDQAFAAAQSRTDGSWGACYEAWFMKVEATVDALGRLADRGEMPQHPIRLLHPIGRPETLVAYLKRLLVSDIAASGVDQRSELGSITASLTTILFKKHVARYVREKLGGLGLGDDYVVAYQSFLNRWQDSATGFWGAWYSSDGTTYRAPDLSLTYHQIAYHPRHIAYWPRIIETTFAMRTRLYPYGWLSHGQFNNHNNYDVARILRTAWPHATGPQKQAARRVIGAMLDWCLNVSLEPDGSFKPMPGFYNSVGASYYYGVSFLDAVGFWNKANRFWTDDNFADAPRLCCAIKARIRRLGLESSIAAEAMQKLDKGCSAC